MEREPDPERRPKVFVIRRLGSTPQQRGSTSDMSCPDMFELSDGSIACIGTDLTESLRSALPLGASIGPLERLVSLPRRTVRDALPDLVSYACTP
ncbi:MAG TPA: hypothetical protein VFU74_16900 [Actinocrinis sp.]|nr:hypothetical protein [Actinocrinis sp.]